jgi:hypothetical protein
MKKNNVDDAWITAVIEEIVATSAENTLNLPTGGKAFDAPLVGFSSGADPLFDHYVAHIGDFYLTPLDIFNKSVSVCGICQAGIPCTAHIPHSDEG